MSDRIVCIIPARLASTRFPRKVLAPLRGKPLVQWAYEGARSCSVFDDVVVAVDSKEVYDTVKGFGGKAVQTSASCRTGTDRLVELACNQSLAADIWVNWQADEPFIDASMIDALLQDASGRGEKIWTLKTRISSGEEFISPHVVKVITDHKGQALYFSRSPIPHNGKEGMDKHIGLYAYTEDVLKRIPSLSPTPLDSENLEQLKFLYHGIPIQVHEVEKEIFGIDTPEELALAQEFSVCYDC